MHTPVYILGQCMIIITIILGFEHQYQLYHQRSLLLLSRLQTKIFEGIDTQADKLYGHLKTVIKAKTNPNKIILKQKKLAQIMVSNKYWVHSDMF